MMLEPLQTSVTVSSWGEAEDGRHVDLYTLRSQSLRVSLCSYGARIVSITMLDYAGTGTDVALGFSSLAEYERDHDTYMGAVVGRFANRIAGGRFTLDGQHYQVPINNGPNALHGGTVGFDRKVWSVHVLPSGVEFELRSPDGEMGFPGTLQVSIRYTLHAGELCMEYMARTDRATVLNLTNHAYFNLAGDGSGTVLNQRLRIDADSMTPINATLIPTGKLLPVEATLFDLRQLTAIGSGLATGHEQLTLARGFDHNFVLNGSGLREVAVALDPESGRRLVVHSTEPGLQFYSGNFLDGSTKSRDGLPYTQHSGFCLETQHFPDSPNQLHFPSTRLDPGTTWRSTTVYRFDHVTPLS